jgi:hypothetical protein
LKQHTKRMLLWSEYADEIGIPDQMNMVALLRRRAEQVLQLASVTTSPRLRTILLLFAHEMTDEADRLEKDEGAKSQH